ncbi:MAG: menaquinone biosynthesis protein [Chthoniobacterales bacterium]|nr:menaquinone biosynthesis protein [Chthoniobacterales bacterium]
MSRVRLGCVKYLNAQPLIYGWPGEVLFDHPAALCQKLAAGELDVALVSSFEFLRQPTYTIIDDIAVAADGPLESVFLAHRGPVEQVREIALDPASQTSVNLLRCLLAERQLHVRFVPEGGEAQLLIGDQAIRFRHENGSSWQYWDLAEQWKRDTSLPFVFALWLVRPEVPNPGAIAEQLRALRDLNLQRLDEVIAAHPEFQPAFCSRYFRERLRFHFGEREKQGLRAFRASCEKHGILPPHHEPLRLV